MKVLNVDTMRSPYGDKVVYKVVLASSRTTYEAGFIRGLFVGFICGAIGFVVLSLFR